MIQTTQLLRDGQITIPASMLSKLGIDNNTIMQLTVQGGILQLRPIKDTKTQGSLWLKDLYKRFASVRDEGQTMDEKEINETINRTIKAVRKAHA